VGPQAQAQAQARHSPLDAHFGPPERVDIKSISLMGSKWAPSLLLETTGAPLALLLCSSLLLFSPIDIRQIPGKFGAYSLSANS